MLEPLIIVPRTVLALIFLFISTKILTKRSLSKLTHFDYLAIATLGTVAGNLAFNLKIRIINFIISMIVITLIIYLVSYLSLKSRLLRKHLAGEPTILIKNGKILENNMSKLKYSYDYLIQQLREKKVFDISHVEFAIFEPNGELSVQLKSQNRPLTPRDLNIQTDYEGLATEIILDGKLIENSLKLNSLTKHWLKDELKKRGIKDIKEVAFAALATNGNLYIDLYRD
ncbi:DUF421 domain-containing protein [Maledivibacter halophilus]|uniref:Uncharacterized membrane protein YcaP, DUF421 family n=1 Tax=Maledivibacter halophilus TaxID=36842 RepID=A0A1T5KRL3_9FIRM|nr:DUF421 domain-containing protein [Maledivibacter halophilus]SKC66059.1 Uncharacterized membrane protein YcaP, DUF421 family [Maledivibacter halophilus]